jgi:hypothetical protein
MNIVSSPKDPILTRLKDWNSKAWAWTYPYLKWFWQGPRWVKLPVTWIVHGLITWVFALALCLPGVLGTSPNIAVAGAILGYVAGVAFYIYKEKKIERLADLPDAIGDILGPVVLGGALTAQLIKWII